jgi:hypothetical protein
VVGLTTECRLALDTLATALPETALSFKDTRRSSASLPQIRISCKCDTFVQTMHSFCGTNRRSEVCSQLLLDSLLGLQTFETTACSKNGRLHSPTPAATSSVYATMAIPEPVAAVANANDCSHEKPGL